MAKSLAHTSGWWRTSISIHCREPARCRHALAGNDHDLASSFKNRFRQLIEQIPGLGSARGAPRSGFRIDPLGGHAVALDQQTANPALVRRTGRFVDIIRRVAARASDVKILNELL